VRILIVSFGSTGDVRPYVALARGLLDLGYEITVATHRSFESLVRENGAAFLPIYGDPIEIVHSPEGLEWLASAGNPLLFGLGLRRLFRSLAIRCGTDCWEAAQGKDAIITSRLAVGVAFHVAEKLKVPLIQAYLQPTFDTTEFPDVHIFSRNRGSMLNRLSHMVSLWFFWAGLQKESCAFRKDLLALPCLSLRETVRQVRHLSTPKLVGISPRLISKPRDWGADFHVTGYWFLPETTWQPGARLLDFLSSGKPPVTVGFGSMNNEDREMTGELVVRALREVECRGVLLSGWGGLSCTENSDDMLVLEGAPHSWLFPRSAAVVHHAGVGTTGECLRSGVAAVPVPFFGDQLYWAWKLHALGVGTSPIPRKRLTQLDLQNAIRTAISNQDLRRRAKDLGRQIMDEDGVGTASTIIDNYLQGRGIAPNSLPNSLMTEAKED